MKKEKHTMFKNLKKKIKENPEDTAFFAILGTVTVALTTFAVIAAKQQAEAEEEFKEWQNEELSKGNVVVQLANGNFIGVPPQSLVS